MTDDTDTTRVGIGMDMIGEAVPPNLSQAIATHLAAQLDARDASAAKRVKIANTMIAKTKKTLAK